MIVVIDTQYRENYGTADEPYWKFKGGKSYKVVDVPATVDANLIVALAMPEIQYSNDYSEEYVLGHSVESDDWISDFERSQLEYDGEIQFPEPTITYGSLVDKVRV